MAELFGDDAGKGRTEDAGVTSGFRAEVKVTQRDLAEAAGEEVDVLDVSEMR